MQFKYSYLLFKLGMLAAFLKVFLERSEGKTQPLRFLTEQVAECESSRGSLLYTYILETGARNTHGMTHRSLN